MTRGADKNRTSARHIPPEPRRGRGYPLGAVGALLLLFGCEPYGQIDTSFWDAVDRAPFVQMAASDAWISYPRTQLVLERHLDPVTQQRVLLPNLTALAGDNFVFMTTRDKQPLHEIGRFRPMAILEQNGGAPEPFGDFEGSPSNSLEDSLGWVHWSQWTDGTDLTCVLAFRRLDAGIRVLPGHSGAIDMMLRNCLRGTAEEALEPIMDMHVGYAATGGVTADGMQRMLSPLAGPRP